MPLLKLPRIQEAIMHNVEEFQIGNPESLPQAATQQEDVVVAEYAVKIQLLRGKTAELTLQLAALIHEAVQKLSPGGQKTLAARVGMSPSALSKYKKLPEERN